MPGWVEVVKGEEVRRQRSMVEVPFLAVMAMMSRWVCGEGFVGGGSGVIVDVDMIVED